MIRSSRSSALTMTASKTHQRGFQRCEGFQRGSGSRGKIIVEHRSRLIRAANARTLGVVREQRDRRAELLVRFLQNAKLCFGGRKTVGFGHLVNADGGQARRKFAPRRMRGDGRSDFQRWCSPNRANSRSHVQNRRRTVRAFPPENDPSPDPPATPPSVSSRADQHAQHAQGVASQRKWVLVARWHLDRWRTTGQVSILSAIATAMRDIEAVAARRRQSAAGSVRRLHQRPGRFTIVQRVVPPHRAPAVGNSPTMSVTRSAFGQQCRAVGKRIGLPRSCRRRRASPHVSTRSAW